jgi:hypothetical protein
MITLMERWHCEAERKGEPTVKNDEDIKDQWEAYRDRFLRGE